MRYQYQAPLQVLRAAKAEMLRNHFYKGPGPGGGCCTVIALNCAADSRTFAFITKAIGLPPEPFGPDVIQAIINWNDAPERTKEDVLAAFDRAIALAEQEATDDHR